MFDQTLVMRFVLTALLLFVFSFSFAQTYATTDEGKRVRLNENGTWEYMKGTQAESNDGPKTFIKPASSTSLLKSKKNDFAVWYNPSKWQLSNKIGNVEAEYQLNLKGQDGYCMIITERIEIDIENLKDAALKNAQNADPHAVIEKEEDRFVNGNSVKMLRISGVVSGIKFVYSGYYASNESGTIQVVCFTSKNLLTNYEKDFEDLLNGFTVKKD